MHFLFCDRRRLRVLFISTRSSTAGIAVGVDTCLRISAYDRAAVISRRNIAARTRNRRKESLTRAYISKTAESAANRAEGAAAHEQVQYTTTRVCLRETMLRRAVYHV